MNTTFSISEELSKSWETFKKHAWIFIGLFVGYAIVSVLVSLIPFGRILTLIVDSIFALGFTRIIFQAIDGEEPQFSAFGQESGKCLKQIGASLLIGLLVLVGLILLVVPGIYVALRLQFVTAVIVEENLGVIDSLKRSWEMTDGHVLQLFLLSLAILGLIIAGVICLGIGILVAAPVAQILTMYVYRKINAPSEMITEAAE